MTLHFSRGGHELPVLIREGKFIELMSRGIFLGFIKDILFEENTINLQSRDKIVLYTDGLTETKNDDGAFFLQCFNNVLLENAELKGKSFINSLLRELESFHGNHEFQDDICIISIDVK